MESRRIKRNGNSLCVILDRGTLENVYHLEENDQVMVDYKYPNIIIQVPKAQERFQKTIKK
jgi:antitoxin component of MazEF toxin-antitoxin module